VALDEGIIGRFLPAAVQVHCATDQGGQTDQGREHDFGFGALGGRGRSSGGRNGSGVDGLQGGGGYGGVSHEKPTSKSGAYCFGPFGTLN
jgi:hypothetical protein